MVFVVAWAPLKNKWLKWLLVITILGTDKWQGFHSLVWQGIFLPELTFTSFRAGSLVVLQSQSIMSTALHAASENMPYMCHVCFPLSSHTLINTWLINLTPPNDIWFLGNIHFYSFSPIGKISSNDLRVCVCVRVFVYSTGIVQNELIYGYASIVHTSSSFHTHTHTCIPFEDPEPTGLKLVDIAGSLAGNPALYAIQLHISDSSNN